MIEWQDLHRSELSVSQFYASLQLRCAVFVAEQNCPYQDIDGDDLAGDSRHIPDWRNNELVAYARIPRSGNDLEPIATGQVAANEALHGEEVGQQLISKALETRTHHWSDEPVYFRVRAHLQNFYQSFGFILVTEVYGEDDIPHIGMAREVIQAQSTALVYS